jgi:predicted dehydrogenase
MHHRTTDVETTESEAHSLELERFVGAVATGDPPALNTVEEGVAVQEVIDGIYRSSEAGEAARLD